MHFNNKEELQKVGKVEKEDTITLHWKGGSYKLVVHPSFILMGYGHDVKIIKEMLTFLDSSLSIHELMNEIYGYECRGGEFPEYKTGDYEAAYKIVRWLLNTASMVPPTYTTTTVTFTPSNTYKIGDVVARGANQGIVMSTSGDLVTVAWNYGEVHTFPYHELIAIKKAPIKEDISKTKQIYNEYLQTKIEPQQGSSGSTGTGVQSCRRGTAIGGGYSGDQESTAQRTSEIRSRKIIGSILS